MDEKKNKGGRPRQSPLVLTPFGVWADQSDMSPDEISEALGIAKSTFYALKSGECRAGAELRIKIEDLTNGYVAVRSWPKKEE